MVGHSLLSAIDQLKQLGFGTIEMITYTGARHSIGEIPGFSYAEATVRERELVFDATRPFAHISAHLPFENVRLFSSDAEERQRSLQLLQEAMDGLAYLRGEMAVMHVGWPERGTRFRDIWRPMVETLRFLGDYAADRNLQLGIETMQPDSVRDFTELVFAVDHPGVGATIDTGHIRGSTDIGLSPERRDTEEARARFNEVLDTIVTILGEKVVHVHLSDVRREDWVDHQTIGTGIIDFPRFFDTLADIGYAGLLVLELEEEDQLQALTASKAFVEELMSPTSPHQ